VSIVAGFIAIALLGAAVSSPATAGGTTVAASNVKAGFGWLTTAIGKLVDPSIPAIAQHGAPSSSTTPASSQAAATATTPASAVTPPSS